MTPSLRSPKARWAWYCFSLLLAPANGWHSPGSAACPGSSLSPSTQGAASRSPTAPHPRTVLWAAPQRPKPPAPVPAAPPPRRSPSHMADLGQEAEPRPKGCEAVSAHSEQWPGHPWTQGRTRHSPLSPGLACAPSSGPKPQWGHGGRASVGEWPPLTHRCPSSLPLRYRTCREGEGRGQGHATSGTKDTYIPIREAEVSGS